MPLHTDRRSRPGRTFKPQSFTRWIPRPLEQLEDRLTPSASITNDPIWDGGASPTSITGGEVSNIPSSPVIGAIKALASDPNNPNILYAGGVNGGVWKTTNALAATPAWVPLTDLFPSLSISVIAINPDNSQQILAGIGGASDGSYAIDPNTGRSVTLDSRGAAACGRIGTLYSSDGGANWKVLSNNIAGQNIVGVAVRNSYMIVAGDSGVFRSTDGGNTFVKVTAGLPTGGVFDLAADPGTALTQIHAATWDNGVATIETSLPHGLPNLPNKTVLVTGLIPGGYNGTFVYTYIDATHFSYSLPANPGNLGAGGTQGTLANAIGAAIWTPGITPGTGVATITTTTANSVAVGESVIIAGVSAPAYNGTFVVTGVLSPTQFTYQLNLAATPGAGTGGLESTAPDAITAATWIGGVATLTTSAANFITVGESVLVSGVALPDYNGTFTVTSVDVANKRFTYALARNPGNTTTGGTETDAPDRIASATWTNGLATITTTAAHNISVGQSVDIAGVSPAGYNGTFTVASVISPTQFTYFLAVSPGAATGTGGTATTSPISIDSATWAAGDVTVATSAPSGVQVGENVLIAGVQPAGYNGTYVVTAVDSPTQFHYALATDPGETITGGTESVDPNIDPQARNRYYVAIRSTVGTNANGTVPAGGAGVFETIDGGVTWHDVTDPVQMQIGANTTNVQITVFDRGIISDNIVYVAVENDRPTGRESSGQRSGSQSDLTGNDYAFANRLSSVSTINYSANQGGVWTRMDVPRTVTETADISLPSQSSGVVTINTSTRHHLRDGDVVVISGVTDNTPAPIGRNAAGHLQVNGIWYIRVTGETSFVLMEEAQIGEGSYIANYSGDFEHVGLNTNASFVQPNGKWQQVLGANAGERSEFFDIATDRLNSNLLYLGTDRAERTFFPGGSGTTSPTGYQTYTGSYWRGDRSINPTANSDTDINSAQWASLVNRGTSNGSAPPADTRNLLLDANNNLFAATGGGIYTLSSPTGRGAWTSVNGNLAVTDINSLALDTLNNRLFAGTIDTQGIAETAVGGSAYNSVFSSGALISGFHDQANVNTVLVDNSRLNNAGVTVQQTTRYYVGTNFGTILRQTVDNTNAVTTSSTLKFAGQNSTTATFSGLTRDSQSINANENVHVAMALNSVDPRRGIFGYNGLYEDADPSGSTPTGDVVNDVTPLDNFGNSLIVGHIESLIYGGRLDNVPINQIVYMTTSRGQLFVRGQFGPSFTDITANLSTVSGQPGSAIYAVVADPDDYRHIFVAQGTKVLETKDFGATFTDISKNLIGALLPDGSTDPTKLTSQVRSLAIYDSSPGVATPGDITLLAGGAGGVFRLAATPSCPDAPWTKYGSGLPNTVVNDLKVYGTRLIAGTAGRGIYQIADVTTTVNAPSELVVTAAVGGTGRISVSLNPTNPNEIEVYDGATTQRFTQGTFSKLTINGLVNGNDEIIIASQVDPTTHLPLAGGSTSFVNFDITVNGNGGNDQLIVGDRGATANVQVTITDTTIGGGVGDSIFTGCGSVTYNGIGSVSVATGTGNDTFLLGVVRTGTTILDGGNGSDTYNATLNPAGSQLQVLDSGFTGNDTLNLTGTAADDSIAIDTALITAGSSTVNYGGLETMSVAGAGGNDSVSLVTQGSGLTAFGFDGGAGFDTLSVIGKTADDTAGIDIVSALGNGSFTGLLPSVAFANTESLAFDGAGGTNSFDWRDRTGGTYGSPSLPATGVIYTPTGAASGTVRVGAASGYPSVAFANVNGTFSMSGDANASNRDVLTILGVSTAGLQSGFGEQTSADGTDFVTVTDHFVTIANAALGALRRVDFDAYSNGVPSFSTVEVRGGNEAIVGDRFNATPSLRTNILIDGMGPASGAAGDQLTIVSAGATTRYQSSDPAFGPNQTRVVQNSDSASLGYFNIEKVSGFDTTIPGGGGGTGTRSNGYFTVTSDAGAEARVQVYDRVTGAIKFDFDPFPGFQGGVRAAVGDVNGDGTPDIVVSAGPGAGPHVKIYDGISGREMASFFAYGPFLGGVEVAVGDLNGDGYAEIITGSGPGTRAHIKVFDGITFAERDSYFTFNESPEGFLGGIRVAVGDVNGDGVADIAVAAQSGAQPRVTVYDGSDPTHTRFLLNFFAYDASFAGGVFIAVGDLNGDGFADVITGAGSGTLPDVRVFSGRDGTLLNSFYANDDSADAVPTVPFEGGVRVATVDLNNDGHLDILTAKGPGTFPILRFFHFGSLAPFRRTEVFEAGYAQGVYVGG